MKKLFVMSTLICILASPVLAGVTFTGMKAGDRTKLERWLTQSTGAKCSINPTTGVLSVAAGGNKAATRLRNMASNPPSVTIQIVRNEIGDSPFGWWNGDAKGKTTGTHNVDIGDIENIGNILTSYGLHPDTVLMHEITEVYEGLKNKAACWTYTKAHEAGIAAEKEIMEENGTSWVGDRIHSDAKGIWTKIKRPDGSYVIIKITGAYTKSLDVEWYKEKTPCNTKSKWIRIADPDPQVHSYKLAYDFKHQKLKSFDTENSMPVDLASDLNGNTYVLEDFPDSDDDVVRVFDLLGNFVDERIVDLANPTALDVDRENGEIYIGLRDEIRRYNNKGDLLGVYSISKVELNPTGLSVPQTPLGIKVENKEFFVSDDVSNQVYVFSIDEDLNQGTYRRAFGGEQLDNPQGVMADHWRSVWVASTGNHRLYRFKQLTGDPITNGRNDYFVEDPKRSFLDVEFAGDTGVYALDGTVDASALLHYDLEGVLQHIYTTLPSDPERLRCPKALTIARTIDESNLIPFVPEGPPVIEEQLQEEAVNTTVLLGIGVVLLVIILVFVVKRYK